MEDRPEDAELAQEMLSAKGLPNQAIRVDTERDFVAALERGGFDLILSDFSIPGFGGDAALREAARLRPDVPFVFVSGTIGEENAVELLKRGATDYVLKGHLARLPSAVSRALSEVGERLARREAERSLAVRDEFLRRVSEASPIILTVLDLREDRLVYVGGATEAVLGYPHEELLAMGPDFRRQLYDSGEHAESPGLQARLEAASAGEVLQYVARIRHRDGTLRHLKVRATVFARADDGRPTQALGVGTDVTAETRAQQLRDTHYAITMILAEGLPAAETKARVVESLGRGLGFAVAEWWDNEPGRLGAAWGAADAEARAFLAAGAAPNLGRWDGLASLASEGRQLQWGDDLEQEARFSRSNLAHAAGLRSWVALPVCSDSRIWGVILCLGREPLGASEELLRLLASIGSHLGGFLSRTEAENAGRASQERFELVARATNDAVWDWDVGTGRVWWNEAVEELFGYAHGEVGLDEHWWRERIHEDDAARVASSLSHALQGTQRWWSDEYRFRRSDGSFATVIDRAFVVRDAAGAPVRVLGSMVDISQKHLADERIRDQAEMLDKASDAITVRGVDGALRYCNKAAERLYGWTTHEGVVPLETFALLQTEPKDALAEARARTLAEGAWTGEFELRPSERAVVLESRWSLVRDAAGRPKSFLVIETDVTDRNKLQSQLLRNQRMESLGTLAGGIAHDLNNVLAPVLTAAQLLKKGLTDERSQRFLTAIETSALRGAEMVKQVLTFARGAEGQRVVLQPRHVLREIETIARETFPRVIEIRSESAGELWTVSGDATQLHQVLLNLCVNARDAMPNGGVLTLRGENATLDQHYAAMHVGARPGDYVVLSVTDSGTGMPSGVLERIFEPFFTTKGVGKGTGLGLSTSLAIVKAHGGFVGVYTEQGRGTTFKVHLPAAGGKAAAPPAPRAEPPAGRGETILVVDDEAGIRELTKDTLESFGYKVITAEDGADAVATAAAHPGEIDVVITDMNMPVMDGLATMRALRRIDPKLRLIGTSGLPSNADGFGDLFASDPPAFLQKPFSAEALLGLLRRLLAG